MARAISAVGLEPEYLEPYSKEPYDCTDDWLFKATMYGYLKGKTPLLIGVVLANKVAGNPISEIEGYHAVTAAGYRLNAKLQPDSIKGVLLRSSQMSKVYVHDDQVGPFSRIEFNTDRIEFEDEGPFFALTTSWGIKDKPPRDIRFVPMCVVVPVYHKLRVPITAILEEVFSLDNFIEWSKANGPELGKERIIWDIYLDEADQLKDDLRNEKLFDSAETLIRLKENLPRYLWRARANCADGPLFEVLFDATDFERGRFCFKILRYNKKYCDTLQAFAENKSLSQSPAGLAARRLLSLFMSKS